MPPPPFSSPYNQPLLPALYLYPLNDTFISKHIPLIDGRRVKIGCQTNSKTSPAERNGYFDSKILSKQHAEVWEENGKIFIKDTKSVNGTFINGERLSPEGVESEPFELKTDDLMEFGIDIIGDDNKTIIHHKIVARVLCMFTEEDVRDAARIERMQNMPTVPGSPAQPGTSGPERTQTEKRRQAVSTPEALGSETPQDTPQQQHEQVSIAGDLTPLTTLSSLPASGPPGEDGDDDLLEVELPSGTPAPLFSYDEPPSSVSSADPREVEVTPPHSFRTMSRLPDGRPSTSPQDACSQEHHDMPVSFGVMPVLKRWLQRFNKTNENHASDPLDQHSIQSNRPATPRSGSKSQPGANAANKRSSWFIPGQRVRRAVAKPVNWSKTGTKGTKASHPNKEASSSGQDHTDPNKTSPAQQATNDATQPSAVTGVNVTQEAGDAIVSIAFKIPAWMLCLCSRTEDGRH
ncbi:hypothetical protein OG21DRAFT_1517678 [Imleria badia]|nr:hypothetical protein OG21DRAFT_1517678 [Imleria badia]